MSLELLSKLETKIQAALETIELQKMELDEEKQKASGLQQDNERIIEQQRIELEEEKQKNYELQQQNEKLQQDLNCWNEKITGLVGLLNSGVEEQ